MTAARLAGIGFRNGASARSILDALARSGGGDVTTLALPADKLGDPAITGLVARGFVVIPVPPDQLTGIRTPTQSRISIETRGTGSVAEACALIAVGPGATIEITRHISGDRMATAAIARKGTS